jgi:predicted choloylglycine hydrolase
MRGRRAIWLGILLGVGLFCFFPRVTACSVVYYVDKHSGKIYVVNNEDYWYDVDAYIQIIPASRKHLARLWYGWDHFAQGGVNEAGLFFDGALTPEQTIPDGYGSPKNNLGDEILKRCRSVEEALLFLEELKIALTDAHMMIGDRTGNAVVLEWVDGQRKVIPVSNNKLIMTNFLLSDTLRGNFPCYRFESIETRLTQLEETEEPATLKSVGNALGGAIQVPGKDKSGRVGGTLYTSFIDLSEMQFVLVYKLDNQKLTHLDLANEFASKRKQKIKLQEL